MELAVVPPDHAINAFQKNPMYTDRLTNRKPRIFLLEQKIFISLSAADFTFRSTYPKLWEVISGLLAKLEKSLQGSTCCKRLFLECVDFTGGEISYKIPRQHVYTG